MRAGVLGANDGIVSVAGLAVGVAGATTDTLDYSVVTADAAAQGLSDGTYDVVITIPEGFSQAVVDTLGGTPSDATVVVFATPPF